jgi:phosphoribosylamine--glycine ligase
LERGAYILKHWPGRSVVKADGLAAGKGVKVCQSQDEAKAFLYELMEKEIFGVAGSTVVIEECLEGQEATVMAFCDGKTLVSMPPSQDHKRIFDDDKGPNTGGMGAYAPAPVVTPMLQQRIEKDIFGPFMKGLAAEKFDYRGIIYFGLMITSAGPWVLEFNVRMGDPETQAVLPLLEGDLALILRAVANQDLNKCQVSWKREYALSVVLASDGYPGPYQTGKPIRGLDKARLLEDVEVYHAGTQRKKKEWCTSGGRVLAVTGLGVSLEAARDRAYEAASAISFEGMHYRKDIGAKAMRTRAIF